MKKLLSLVLVIVLCVGCLSSCAQIKEWTGFDIEGTFNDIKDSVMGALGLGESVEDKLANAKDYLDSQYKSKAEATPADYVVYHVLSINENGENVKYEVTWTVSGRDGATITDADVKVVVAEDGTTTIDVNEKAEADIPYVLTATIKHPEGKTVTTSYNRLVPKFVELTHAQFTATADDQPVIVKGIINGIVNTNSKWELYFQDKDGGYYVYNLKQDQVKDLKIGQEIRVSGIKGTYYGVHQVEDASIEVLNATPVAVTAKDITADVLAAKDLTVKDVTKYQSMFVTIKGAFILGQVSGDSTYYDFLIGDEMSYLRISGSANMLNEADTTAFKNAFKDATHKDADVSGIVSIYNNKIYLIPVSSAAVGNVTTADRTDAEKVAIEEKILDAVGAITEAGSKTLQNEAKTYKDVTFTWSLAETEYATLEGNVLNVSVLPDEAQNITLTLTLTLGETTVEKEYTVRINAIPKVVPNTDITITAGTKYKLVVRQKNLGQVLYWTGEQDGNYLVGTTDPTKAADIVAELVEGTTDKYYLYVDINGARKYINVHDNAEGTSPTVSLDRNTLDISNYFKYDTELKLFTVDVVVLPKNATETVTETRYFGCYNQFNTFSLSNISYITGSNAANVGKTQFPAYFAELIDTTNKTPADMIAEEKAAITLPESFDYSTALDLISNGAIYPQVTVAWAVSENAAISIADGKLVIVQQDADVTATVTATITAGGVSDTKTFEITVAKLDLTSIADALAAADGTVVTVKGTVKQIDTPWSESYGNISVTITDGTNTLYIYRLATKVEVGEIVVISGTMATYNNARQIAQGATAVSLGMDESFVPEVAVQVTIPEALEKEDGVLVEVSGTVTEINTAWSDSYGNISVTISDGTNTLYIYRLATKVELGDIITVTGRMGTYNGRQIAQGATAIITGKDDNVQPEDPQEPVGTSTIAAVISGENGEYTVAGTVIATNARGFLIKDSTGILFVYAGSNHTAVVGDTATVKGTSSVYGYAKQLGGTVEYTKTGTASVDHGTPVVLDKATIESYNAAESVTPVYVKVTATLSVSGNYYNLTFADTTVPGSIPYPANGDEIAALAGKTVEVTGYFIYNSGSAKYFNILAMSVTEVTTDGEGEGEGETPAVHTCADANGDFVCDTADCGKIVEPAADSVLTIEQAIALATLYINENGGSYTTGKYYVTGTIKAIISTTYGQMTLVDENGNEFGPYNTYSADGSNRYDAMEVKPVKGDTVTIYGQIGSYYSTIQMNSGARITAHTAHNCDWADATCEAPSTCTICGATTGEKADHVYVDGTCTGCGATEGVEYLNATLAYTDTTTTTNMTGNNDAATLGLDASIFTVTSDKGAGSNHCGLNKAGQIRLYYGSNGEGSSFTVTAADGYTIKSIKVTFGSKIGTCAISVDDTVVSTCTTTNTTVEVDVNSDNFKLKNTHSTNVQVYITGIEITYCAA